MNETIVVKNQNGLEIKVGGIYSKGSLSFKVICNDRNNRYSIVYLLSDGDLCITTLADTTGWKEHDPLYDLKVDDKVFVRDFENRDWYPRHFAEVKNDKIAVFINGKTSFTNGDMGTNTFKYWKKAD